MIKEKFGDRLFRLRKDANMTIDEFVTAMNSRFPDAKLNKSIVSKYENKIHKPSRFSLIEEIAEFYHVSTDYIMCRNDDKYGEEIKYKKVPILGTIACGTPILAQQDIQGYEYVLPHENVDFCLKTKGDSMIGARIFNGDIVYIRQQPDVENGEIAAVQVDNEEATLKRVYKIDGSIILRPENSNYKDMIFSKKDKKDVCILGKAIFFKSEVR
ncbi:helix-turn-helix domain-containing protein [Clostridium sp.]|uniref:helix-turn-helix domain-containing protein n=1 Tax=Clostridium sp. TaxID=1506 RepID=UPI0035A11455